MKEEETFRECRIKVENYYLCVCCGSGPQKSSSYTQGTICPKCGSGNISSLDDRRKECADCKHSFNIPSRHLLTGISNNH